MDLEETLSRKLESLFQDTTVRSEVCTLLENYGKEDHEKETARVKLAILKLSGSDKDEISKFTMMAKQDYRDVLAWAEYPRQSKQWSISDQQKKQKLIQADRDEYEKWLSTS